ncbi:Fibrillin-1, partial [Frankliniella fusca]
SLSPSLSPSLPLSLSLRSIRAISRSVADINECDDPAVAARCVANAECCNLPAHFVCRCLPGFEGDGEEECRDINECEHPEACGINAVCTNVPGNYSCACLPGYHGNPFDACVDLDECQDPEACGPGALCRNVVGGHECLCPPGFHGDAYRTGCVDEDECARAPCGRGALCTNMAGSYRCVCPQGSYGDPFEGCIEKDACAAAPGGAGPCGAGANCTTVDGQAVCACPPGYTGPPHQECLDLNECGRPNACGVNAKCINSVGSFSCTCPPGFSGQGQLYCENINECAHNPCGENAVCTDTIGSFICSCREDYTGDPFKGCVDINECVALDRPCGRNALCENASPGYNCVCPQGYQAKPHPTVACEQIDVNILCKSNFDCTNNAECVEGQCFCQDGFAPQGAVCVDVDECAASPCGLHAACHNTPGSFRCDCEPGFVGAPPRLPCKAPCEDVKCGQHAYCKPDGQEAYCICEDGWTFNPANIAAGCIDIDECDKINGPFGQCGANSVCTNTPGGFSCQCKPGFSGNAHKQCLDIDECARHDACGVGAVCRNTPGAYTCECPKGTVPDPDPHTKCIGVVTCAADSECPGNAICDSNRRCFCPQPNVGSDCRHPCEFVYCGPNAQCMLTNDEAKCMCRPGFTGVVGVVGGCVDIDECAANPCPGSGVCFNEPGSFSCQCPSGLSGDPYKGGCARSDNPPFSCGPSAPCPASEQCVPDHTSGANVCICRQGYVRDATTGKCRDVNECTELRDKPACGLNAVCKNLAGSYECACPPGFNGNPFSSCQECSSLECQCQPPYQIVDGNCLLSGCEADGLCPGGAECVTIAGGVSYCACPHGYRPDGNGVCQDINECLENKHMCSYGAECVNQPGAHQCVCPLGTSGDPYHGVCSPNQVRCVADTDCLANEKCVQPGECVCPPPFFTDALDANKCKSPCERFPCGINARCTPSDPPRCLCEAGFKGDPLHGCVDVDECAENPCAAGAHCINEKGSFKCVCSHGLSGDPYRQGCVGAISPKGECSRHSDCAGPLACEGGVCVNPCNSLPCGANAFCEAENHAAWCRCAIGFSEGRNGECVSLCEGMVCGRGAQCIVTAAGPTCACVEGYLGNPFAGGACLPDVCSAANPCAEPMVCIGGRCKQRCEGVVCGVGATCDKNTNKCVCDPFFIGNPDYLCMPPVIGPQCTPACGINAHCEYGQDENRCVCNAGTIGNPYEGCGQEPRQSCTANTCGHGAVCRDGMTDIECLCPPGYTGNPYIQCFDVDECSGGVACGNNAVCINTPGAYDCRCKQGFAGNPFSICLPLGPRVCNNPADCKCGKEVTCPNGYSCTKGRCRNPCDGVECGPRAGCVQGQCVCPPGLSGNPKDKKKGCLQLGQCQNDLDCADTEICFQHSRGVRKCVDACSKLQCGANALCVANHHRSSCICADGFAGAPGDLLTGCQPERAAPKGSCQTDRDCAKGLICALSPSGVSSCVNPCINVACGSNEVCSVDASGHPACSCRDGYSWNPVTSVCEKPSLPDCTSDGDCQQVAACRPDALGVLKCVPVCAEFTCPPNAICSAAGHRGQCQCLPDFTGNPNDRTGCSPVTRNECDTDAQCPQSSTCRADATGALKCRPACESARCGPGAVCVVNNHVAQCQCPPGPYAGDPNDPVNGCRSVPCVYNLDCPPTQLCNRLTHTCHDACEEGSCGENAVCLAEDHRATCQCPPGYRANPLPEVECVASEVCNPNPCHPTALCEATATAPAGFVCRCPPGLVGDAVTTGCRPEGNCPRGDADCPAQAVCQAGRCVNPCESACGPNALCTVINRKPVCSCPARFDPVAAGPASGCVRAVSGCVSDADCLGDACVNGQCRAVCRRAEDCSAGERCVQKTCVLPCAGHSQCAQGQACVAGVCALGCRSNRDCPSQHACVNNKCQDPCSQEGVCGPNALCSCRDHATVCSCPDGFQGAPTPQQGCVRVPARCGGASAYCPSAHSCVNNLCRLPCDDNANCALGERCSDNFCVKVCYGDSNCLTGEVCVEGTCRPGCSSDVDCEASQVCRGNKCLCGSGFTSTPRGCKDVDECEQNPCHPSARCTNVPGSYLCSCQEGTVGDPFLEPGCVKPSECLRNSDCGDTLACVQGRCTDPCTAGVRCGPNAVCNVFDHVPSCSCPAGNLGDPNDPSVGCFRVECLTSDDCPSDRLCHLESYKCMNPCDHVNCGRGTCKAQKHQGVCTCFPGYVFEDGRCQDIDECQNSPCHSTAVCQNSPGSFACVCADGLVGDPVRAGCRKPGDCFTDADCPATAACLEGRCRNPCQAPGVCGRNAQCVVAAHAPQCLCPAQTSGDARVECVRLECADSNDCAANKACIDAHCVDPCSLPNVCGQRAACTAANHVAVCACEPGSTGDPHLGCVSVQYCGADSQCPAGTRCSAGICTSLCTTARECIGDQLCIQGVCQPTCRSNSSCPEYQYCQNNICIQEVRCRADDDCGGDEQCRANSLGQAECVNPCDGPVLCGRNAECAARDHTALCSCKPGHHGNPTDDKIGCQPIECRSDDDCSNDKLCDNFMCKIACLVENPCGRNALCSAQGHRQVCFCQPGYTGDPHAGCKLIDFCADSPCGPLARCENARGSFKCLCPLGTVGDPYRDGCHAPVECEKNTDCPGAAECVQANGVPKCKDICESTLCGPNADCVARDHAGACQCRPGYEGNPNDITVGCRPRPVACKTTKDCPTNAYCYGELCRPLCQSDEECGLTEQCSRGQCTDVCDQRNACGMNAECRVLSHRKVCSCPPGFTGNHDVECVRIPVSCDSTADCTAGNSCRDSMCLPVCSSDDNCAFNEKCLKGNCILTCRVDNDCFLGHICLHNMCMFGCHDDSDCSASESCRDNRCVNPCQASTCGPNAACSVYNQRASCSCQAGFVPNPTAKVACVRTPALPCSENRDCPVGATCLESACRPVCSSDGGCLGNERCDAAAGVCKPLCRRDDDCRSGEVCEGLMCVAGCRSDSGCPGDRACVGSKCIDLCASPTACGTNAVCAMRAHQKVCQCPAPLIGDAHVGCRHAVTGCERTPDCADGQSCYAGLCLSVCRTDIDCLSDERCVGGVCKAVCNSDSKCGPGQICENRLCDVGCRSDVVCPDNQACIDKQCRDPCEGTTTCGTCAVCRVSNHNVQCSCPAALLGDPLVACVKPARRCGADAGPCDCDEAGYCANRCGAHADCDCGESCEQGRCRVRCSPGAGCPPGLICVGGSCLPGCRSHADCPNDRACLSGQCGDPCTRSPCGLNALCRVSDHRALCLCPDGFQGEPTKACTQYECLEDSDCEPNKRCGPDKACRNPCLEPGTCGANAQCRVVGRRAQCSCPPGRIGNPQVECRQGGEECLRNPCGENARCRDVAGGFECSCAPGCRGDPYRGCVCEASLRDLCRDVRCGVNADCRVVNGLQAQCYCPPNYPSGDPLKECTIERGPSDCRTLGCGDGAECVRKRNGYVCRCPPGSSGHPDVACQPVSQCASDSDCPLERACVGSQCVDPCSLRHACGQNALCTPILHRPRCACPQCYIGQPLVGCRPDPQCASPAPPRAGACRSDADCSDSLACRAGECRDPCVTPGLSCESSKKCQVRHHRPVCVCKAGFVVNDVGELTCAPERRECSRDEECAPNRACTGGRCVNPCAAKTCPLKKSCQVVDHKPICLCTADCHPELSICLRDSGCPQGLACIDYRCTDPCTNMTCPQGAPCYVEEHRAVCKFCPQGFNSDQNSGCTKGKSLTLAA